jgi:hypothetical protein
VRSHSVPPPRPSPASRRRGFALVIAVTAVLAGCSRQEPAPDPLKAQRSAVQKAKGVNDVVTGAAADQRKQIDEQETK